MYGATRIQRKIWKEYSRITSKEEICRVAQITINNLCDYARKKIIENISENEMDMRSINCIARTDISNYLFRKCKRMINCMYTPLKREGVTKLYELCTEAEIEQENNRVIRIGYVFLTPPPLPGVS